MEKFSIKELVEKANKVIDENEEFSHTLSYDKRRKKHISVRRARDWQTKGYLGQPIKEGRNVFYNKDHLSEILKNREAQELGYSDRNMSLYNNKTNQEDIISTISEIRKINGQNSRESKVESNIDNNNFPRSLEDIKYNEKMIHKFEIQLSNAKINFEINEKDFKKISQEDLKTIKDSIDKIFK